MSYQVALLLGSAFFLGLAAGMALGGSRSAAVTLTEEVETSAYRVTLRVTAPSMEKAQSALKRLREAVEDVK